MTDLVIKWNLFGGASMIQRFKTYKCVMRLWFSRCSIQKLGQQIETRSKKYKKLIIHPLDLIKKFDPLIESIRKPT